MSAGRSVYVIAAGLGTVKIGLSRDPEARLAGLQVASPVALMLAYAEEFVDVSAHDVERVAHRLMAGSRASGEWFHTSVDDACKAIKRAAEIVRSRPAADRRVWPRPAKDNEFVAWQERMDITCAEAARLLGKSEDTISRYRLNGIPNHMKQVLELACYAIENGIPAWGSTEPAVINRRSQ
ncbi:MAG: GIY-YIG nuclease family protein [Mesorhizobium sp.]|nr:MAG: GIY-YIG nuclease family protein [Mesorhizobium sp.]